MSETFYRGRLAPSPTGYLHLGHARTFLAAYERAKSHGGQLLLRIEDIDAQRCQPEYIEAIYEDLKFLGLQWNGYPILQSKRIPNYERAWQYLKNQGFLYPCEQSRKAIQAATTEYAHGEAIFPKELRSACTPEDTKERPGAQNWRFRVPDGQRIAFEDKHYGRIEYTAGVDFGDFLVWRKDDAPAYELAVVVDDLGQNITEVVRGADLLLSTARQALLFAAFESAAPAYYHCPLIMDAEGKRLAKRTDSLSIRRLRELGFSAEQILREDPLKLQKLAESSG